MASRKPKHVAAMFFYLIIFDIRKLLDYKFIYFINHVWDFNFGIIYAYNLCICLCRELWTETCSRIYDLALNGCVLTSTYWYLNT